MRWNTSSPSGWTAGSWVKSIGVDEIQYAKGHKYLTLVYQIDLEVTRLLWVGRERAIQSFQGFFTVIGDELASKIVFVRSDMWEPLKKIARSRPSTANSTFSVPRITFQRSCHSLGKLHEPESTHDFF